MGVLSEEAAPLQQPPSDAEGLVDDALGVLHRLGKRRAGVRGEVRG